MPTAPATAPRPPVSAPQDGLARILSDAVLQRAVAGISTPEALKLDKQAWGTFVLCDEASRNEFQADVLDAGKNVALSHYIDKAKVSGRPVMRAWFASNAPAIVAPAPGRIDVAHQNPDDYGGWGDLLRFRWFGRLGPFGPTGKGAKVPVAVFGINLHRGPRYAGLGHAWAKIGDELVFEFVHDIIEGDKSAIVAALEGHASGAANASLRNMANNANCVPPVDEEVDGDAGGEHVVVADPIVVAEGLVVVGEPPVEQVSTI